MTLQKWVIKVTKFRVTFSQQQKQHLTETFRESD